MTFSDADTEREYVGALAGERPIVVEARCSCGTVVLRVYRTRIMDYAVTSHLNGDIGRDLAAKLRDHETFIGQTVVSSTGEEIGTFGEVYPRWAQELRSGTHSRGDGPAWYWWNDVPDNVTTACRDCGRGYVTAADLRAAVLRYKATRRKIPIGIHDGPPPTM